MCDFDVELNRDDRILVVAPHPDDESIGMGGFMTHYAKRIDVIILTDGRRGNPDETKISSDKLCAIRKDECRSALQTVGINRLFFEDVADGTVIMQKRIQCIKDFSNYKYIFVPNRMDAHMDHRAAYRLFRKIARDNKKVLVEYEVWSPIDRPNFYFDITKYIDNKKKMIKAYESQLETCNYTEMITGLNQYRGESHHLMYAEAFRISSCNGIQAIRECLIRVIPLRMLDVLRYKIHNLRNKNIFNRTD